MKNISRIVKISKPLHHLVYILAILIVITSLMNLVMPLFSKFIVDEIVAKIQGHGGNLPKLFTLIAISFAIQVIGTAITSISNRLGDHFAGRLRKFLTERFYHKVLTLPQSYFDTQISGKIINQLNRGIFTIYGFLNNASNFILPMFLQAIFTIAIMAYYNIYVALFTFALFPIYIALSYFSTKRWGEKEVLKNQIEDRSRGRINEVLGNIKLVKSFTNEQQEYQLVSSQLTDINKIYASQSSTFHIYDFARNFSLIIIFVIVSVIVFYNTYLGKFTIGEMVLILQLMNQARAPLFGMSFILSRLQEAESGSKEFFEILDLKSEEHFDKESKSKLIAKPSIKFDDVSFKYEESELVLKNISFDIDAYEKVALVGHSGVGKSTIVNLILKFYKPTKGKIFIDSQNYDQLDHVFVRKHIALVFQENELFSSTVRENVSYGNNANEKEIIAALKLANAWEFVDKLPKGLDSTIGERGVRLSGGQKQRIQIARAILKDAPILILDEATSSLDSRSEREVQIGLENLMKNRMVIIIAHRFSTIQNVDKVMVVDEGKIVDYGSPQQLSKRKGVYSELLHYQIEGNQKLLEQFDITG